MHYSLLYYVCLFHVQIDKEWIYKKHIQKNKTSTVQGGLP